MWHLFAPSTSSSPDQRRYWAWSFLIIVSWCFQSLPLFDFSSLADCLADNKLCSKPNHESYHSIHEVSFLILRSNSLTFVDHSEVDLSNIALKVWRVSHLAAVGAIKSWIHVLESDGSIFSHDISRPHYMPFELRRRWRVRRFILVVKQLPHTLQKKTKKRKCRNRKY